MLAWASVQGTPAATVAAAAAAAAAAEDGRPAALTAAATAEHGRPAAPSRGGAGGLLQKWDVAVSGMELRDAAGNGSQLGFICRTNKMYGE